MCHTPVEFEDCKLYNVPHKIFNIIATKFRPKIVCCDCDPLDLGSETLWMRYLTCAAGISSTAPSSGHSTRTCWRTFCCRLKAFTRIDFFCYIRLNVHSIVEWKVFWESDIRQRHILKKTQQNKDICSGDMECMAVQAHRYWLLVDVGIMCCECRPPTVKSYGLCALKTKKLGQTTTTHLLARSWTWLRCVPGFGSLAQAPISTSNLPSSRNKQKVLKKDTLTSCTMPWFRDIWTCNFSRFGQHFATNTSDRCSFLQDAQRHDIRTAAYDYVLAKRIGKSKGAASCHQLARKAAWTPSARLPKMYWARQCQVVVANAWGCLGPRIQTSLMSSVSQEHCQSPWRTPQPQVRCEASYCKPPKWGGDCVLSLVLLMRSRFKMPCRSSPSGNDRDDTFSGDHQMSHQAVTASNSVFAAWVPHFVWLCLEDMLQIQQGSKDKMHRSHTFTVAPGLLIALQHVLPDPWWVYPLTALGCCLQICELARRDLFRLVSLGFGSATTKMGWEEVERAAQQIGSARL